MMAAEKAYSYLFVCAASPIQGLLLLYTSSLSVNLSVAYTSATLLPSWMVYWNLFFLSELLLLVSILNTRRICSSGLIRNLVHCRDPSKSHPRLMRDVWKLPKESSWLIIQPLRPETCILVAWLLNWSGTASLAA